MDFYTPVSYPKVTFRISYSDSIMLLGSCFVENMGNRLEQYKFKTDINPFGTLYNPLSIASSIERLISPVEFTADDLFQSGGQFHSFQHHSRFSASSDEHPFVKLRQFLLAMQLLVSDFWNSLGLSVA